MLNHYLCKVSVLSCLYGIVSYIISQDVCWVIGIHDFFPFCVQSLNVFRMLMFFFQAGTEKEMLVSSLTI